MQIKFDYISEHMSNVFPYSFISVAKIQINGKNTFNLNLRVIAHAMCLSVPRISLNEAINCLILPQWCHKKHFGDESKIIINAHY